MKNLLLEEKVNDFYSVPDQIQGFKINGAGYGMVPKLVMLDKRLHVTAKAIYAYFCSYTGAGDTCFPSRKKICNDLDISIESFTKYSKQLVDVGYVEKKQIKEKGRFSHNLYTLLDEVPPCTEKTSQVLEKAGKICTSTVYGFSVYGKTDTKINSNIKINKLNKKESKKEETPQLSFEKLNFKEENIFEQKKVSKKETELSFDALIEKYTQNENLRFELKEHLKIRKLKKSALSNHALELSFRKLDALSNNDSEKIEIVKESIMNSWIGFFPLKPYEKIQKRPSPVSQNTSYNIDEYESSMDVFASNDESNPVDEFNPMDEIRKKQKQVDPSFEKFKAEIKDDAIKRFGPRLGNKILKIKEREEFWETVDTLKDMIKRGQYVWFNGDLVCAADIEEKEEKENFDLFGISDSPQIEPVFDF